MLQERAGNNLLLVTYTRGNDLSGSLQEAGGIGGLLARSEMSNPQSTHAYYHADGNGTVTALVTTNGLLVARYHYDPYGNTLAAVGPLAEANLYRFSSKEWHPNSALVYYLYRYYSPTLQRWINPDPIGNNSPILQIRLGANLVLLHPPPGALPNRYWFLDNGPIDHLDYLGLWTIGLRLSISLVIWNLNIGLYIDSRGGYENQCSTGWGFTAGVSITGGVTMTTAESVKNLRNETYQAGISGGIPLGAQGEINAVWGDGYFGVDLGIGLGAGSPISPQGFKCNTRPID
ncbi:MAG: RHS repeat-associated core domain-containing protein [Verrucomicrobiae bacterium]|nr:RHS repeat-associated core domain-containing protein [Verrucomicrobiae bacterium]